MTGATAWADAVRALALFAADPLGLAGIAIRAGAGPVRDHFLTLLRDALPPAMRMHRLPANTSDERLLGGLDLAATLQAGRPIAQRGLLAEADGGVVVLAMAERISPATAARLRAALDDAAVSLQRDGLSRILPTRFAIIALDEGIEPDERPPASLLDRMAFHVDLTEVSLRDMADSPSLPPVMVGEGRALSAMAPERPSLPVMVGEGRALSAMAPERPSPPVMVGEGRALSAMAPERPSLPVMVGEGRALSAMAPERPSLPVMVGEGRPSTACSAGIEKGVDGPLSPTMTPSGDGEPLAASIPCGQPLTTSGAGISNVGDDTTLGDHGAATPPADAIESLCQAALALGIDSLRVPFFALRAAYAAATADGRGQLTDADICLAARLVLAPRATRFPPPADAEEPLDAEPPTEPETTDRDDQPPDQPPDQPLADVVLDAAKAALPPDLLARLASADGGRGLARVSGRAGQFKASTKRGRPVGTRQGDPKGGARLNLLETLKAAAPWQTLRHASAGRLEVRRDDLRIVRFRQRIGTTTVFAVDASGSSAMHRLGEAKGAVELLLADCYVRRDQVALLAFRGQGATLLLPPTGSLLRAKRSLAGLPGGGPTPLAAGIEAAVTLAGTIRRAGRTPVITLLTDARANIARDGTSGRPRAEAEAIDIARSVRAFGVATLLVDTSPRPNAFARRLADEMRAQYLPLPYADASALSRAARSAARPA